MARPFTYALAFSPGFIRAARIVAPFRRYYIVRALLLFRFRCHAAALLFAPIAYCHFRRASHYNNLPFAAFMPFAYARRCFSRCLLFRRIVGLPLAAAILPALLLYAPAFAY